MEKTKIKDILDWVSLVLLILATILLYSSKNTTMAIVAIIVIILAFIIKIIDIIFWRCSKCGHRLPNQSIFAKVISCPYCNTDINEKNSK